MAGYVPSTTSRKAIGSLVLVGYYDKGKLVHVGRVGTGYSPPRWPSDLYRRLDARSRPRKASFAKPADRR